MGTIVYNKPNFTVWIGNVSYRNSSQYNRAYCFDFMGFPGTSQGFPVTIIRKRGYPNLATKVARSSERVNILKRYL